MIGRILQRTAECIYDILERGRLSYMVFPKEVRRNLQQLGIEEKQYYTQKLQYILGLVVVGCICTGIFVVQAVQGSNKEIERVERPAAHEKSQEIMLQIGEQALTYPIEVNPVVLTQEEAEELVQEAVTLLQERILGENKSLEGITANLTLPEYLDGYPFDIYWKSDKEQIVDSSGNVNRIDLKEDTVIVLTAEFHYKEWMWQEQFGILVLQESLSEEEQYERSLRDFLEGQEAVNQGERVWELPKTFEGNELQYQVAQKDYTMLWLAVIAAGTGLGLWFGKDLDIRTTRSKRQEVFGVEYATLVNSLSLYISAGMTVPQAMKLCVRDYERRKPEGHLMKIALWDFEKDLDNGWSFSAAIDRLSEVCDNADYQKLAGMLSQGIINGTQGLAVLLEKEAERVREEKRRQAKVKGEQISTALIAPMMLQLGIVIALIMLPAFRSLQF